MAVFHFKAGSLLSIFYMASIKREYIRKMGSHVIYKKDGKTYPVPYHRGKELGKGLEKKIRKEMGLK